MEGFAASRMTARNASSPYCCATYWTSAAHAAAEQFVFGILPGLLRVPAKAMARATGLSAGYCTKIKQGQQIPHQRHWPTLAALR